MSYVLTTENVTKVYEEHKAVNRVNMHVEKGAIYGFIGKNGAGKTTFMRMVAGLAAPTEGSIELFGSKDLEKQCRRIGTLIEHAGIYPNMTAKDNLEIVRRNFGIAEKNAVDEEVAANATVWDDMDIATILPMLFSTACSLIVTIFASIFVYGEYANGAIKNVVEKGYNRWCVLALCVGSMHFRKVDVK